MAEKRERGRPAKPPGVKKVTVTTMRLRPPTLEWIDREAKLRGRHRSGQLEYIIERYRERREKGEPEPEPLTEPDQEPLKES